MRGRESIQIMWETEVQNANSAKGGRTFTLLDDRRLLLAYTQYGRGLSHKGKLEIISNGTAKDLFETKLTAWSPAVGPDGTVYLPTSVSRDEGRLFAIDSSNGAVKWEYKLAGRPSSAPVVFQDSVFVCDFSADEGPFRLIPEGNHRKLIFDGERRCHIYRLSSSGELIWERLFNGINWFEPLVLENKEQIVIGINFMDKIILLDMKGKTIWEKPAGHAAQTCGFTHGKNGEFYVCLDGPDGGLVAFSENFDILWKYKPGWAFVANSPAVDSDGNLFLFLSGCRLASLDSHGSERWVVRTGGDHGFIPDILPDGNILVLADGYNSDKPKVNDLSTYAEVYSPDGKKLLVQEFPGCLLHSVLLPGGMFYMAIAITEVFPKEEREKSTLKLYSMRYPY